MSLTVSLTLSLTLAEVLQDIERDNPTQKAMELSIRMQEVVIKLEHYKWIFASGVRTVLVEHIDLIDSSQFLLAFIQTLNLTLFFGEKERPYAEFGDSGGWAQMIGLILAAAQVLPPPLPWGWVTIPPQLGCGSQPPSARPSPEHRPGPSPSRDPGPDHSPNQIMATCIKIAEYMIVELHEERQVGGVEEEDSGQGEEEALLEPFQRRLPPVPVEEEQGAPLGATLLVEVGYTYARSPGWLQPLWWGHRGDPSLCSEQGM